MARFDLYDNELQHVAHNLAGGAFSGPFACETGPTAIVAPGYPAVLAAIYRWLPNPEIYIGIFNSLVSALTYALLPVVATSLEFGAAAGIAGGFLGALAPYLPVLEARGAWESPLLTLLLVAALILMPRPPTVRMDLLRGCVWGLTFLIGPQVLPIFMVLVAYVCWRGQWKSALSMSVVAMMVVSPWIVRNYVELDHVFWIRSGAGLELQMSNNPGAQAQFDDNLARSESYIVHPSLPSGACQVVQQIGEVTYFNRLGAQALEWIRENPGRFFRLTTDRVWYFWLPPFDSLIRWLYCVVLTALGLAGGIFIVFKNKSKIASTVVVAVLGMFPLFYYVVAANPRYRSPIQPILILSAMYILIYRFRMR